jgi:hypothetical protein
MSELKTEQLLDLLAQGAGPVAPGLAWRRLLPSLGLGVLGAVLLLVGVSGLLPGPAFATPVPWIKLAYAAVLGGVALPWVWRLARPGADPGRVPPGLVVAGLAVAVAGGAALWAAAPGDRVDALLGRTWAVCPRNVLLLALPSLAGLLWALRGLAPTRPRRAGAAAGLLAGAAGAAVYGLSCPEPSAAFVALWYSAGVLATVTLGAALGPRVLRW